MDQNRRNYVFISYAHEDDEWRRRLLKNLKPSIMEGKIALWDDSQIQPGMKWFENIREAIEQSSVAVLLVSPDFLDSDFILPTELPLLRAAAEKRGLRILWVAVRPVAIPAAITDLQALHNPGSALSTLSESEQDQVFVKICNEIQRVVRERSEVILSELRREARTDDSNLRSPLRTFVVRPLEAGPCLIDSDNQLWVMEEQQIKVFHVSQEAFLGREMLPNRPWKGHLNDTWRGHAVLSDWTGAIYRFDGQHRTREKPLYEARNDDLPVHRLAVGPAGHLFAAAWNGVIRRWDADGIFGASGWPVRVPALPLWLAPLADGGLVVADQAQEIHCYTPSGEVKWRWRVDAARTAKRRPAAMDEKQLNWRPDDTIQRLWATPDESHSDAIVVQIGRRYLLRMINGEPTECLEFPSDIKLLETRKAHTGEQWGLVACEGGQISWLSMVAFSTLDRTEVDFPVRQISIIPDLQSDTRLMAAGLSEDGRVFTLEEGNVRRYDQPSGIRRLLADHTGRFLYLVFDRKIEVYANPITPALPCRIDVDGLVAGRLKRGNYCPVLLKLRNVGLIPIHQVHWDIASSDVEQRLAAAPILSAPPPQGDPHSAGNPPAGWAPILNRPLRPGECFDLQFSAWAKVGGNVPLLLRLRLVDEGGSTMNFEKTLLLLAED